MIKTLPYQKFIHKLSYCLLMDMYEKHIVSYLKLVKEGELMCSEKSLQQAVIIDLIGTELINRKDEKLIVPNSPSELLKIKCIGVKVNT